MILWAIFFLAGIIVGVCNSERLSWVRGAAGKARGVVLGSRPAAVTEREQTGQKFANPAAMIPSGNTNEVSPTPPKNPIRAGEALKVIADAARFAWHWRYVIAAVVIAFFAWRILAPVVSFASCPFGPGILWCADKEKIDANADTRALEHEADMGRNAVGLSERTHNNIDHAERMARAGIEDLEDAVANLSPDVSEADFADLQRRYVDAYLGVYSFRPDDTDPNAGRSEPVRRARTNAA